METDDNIEQLKYWRITAATSAQALRELRKQTSKQIADLETQLSETRTQLAYWREIALENQTNV